ncbi:Rv1733c family protein [Streptomyces sp. FR-108]|uniref:Rv1733c family protein n=1 Tax=Streptomyces sp. FR-108 TaxID=3416665 RepID=UPI003CF4169C
MRTWEQRAREKRARVIARRWRHNPLCRRADVVEAWTALVVSVVLWAGTPLAGLAAGRWAYEGARATAAEQRAERHRVLAEIVEGSHVSAPGGEGDRRPVQRVSVRWAEPGERTRKGETRVAAGAGAGDRTYIWVDRQDRIVPAPTSDTVVRQHALAVGACATGVAAAGVLTLHALIRRRAACRRLAEWEREWARTGPEWARHHT